MVEFLFLVPTVDTDFLFIVIENMALKEGMKEKKELKGKSTTIKTPSHTPSLLYYYS